MARWVFRYDKSPRKSPFLPSISFSRFSLFLIPHLYSLFPCRLSSFLILSPSFHSFYFSFFFSAFGSSRRRNRATFLLSDRYFDERIRADENDILTHEFPFNSHRDAILNSRSESHDSWIFQDILAFC